ncbi:MAG: acyltransferase [Gammaproteobacteria bacterium]|nr:acyltransferase [Gammaproteobacteria bacterium]MBQ0774087.1 acyltransferase [Gammaproteobacteria bacterium]|tara:strand:+ start:136230 stop:137117 length:888 start_codon:yes stop_codon:yes gene_type:complete
MNLLHKIRAVVALVAMFINTFVMVMPLYVLALLKLILPVEMIRVWLSKGIVIISEAWIANNNAIIALFGSVRWQVEGLEGLSRKQWYFVVSNHQSWSDILVLQRIFNRRIPLLKFFLKQELIKVPLLGLAWWALDFPFMKRYTRAEIEKNPELKGKDVETTRLACQKFEYFPTSVMNFLEGTRFTPDKQAQQQSPYRHLLKPKSGGAAFALGAMAGTLKTLVDVTIVYPKDAPRTLFAFLGGSIKDIKVIVRQQEIPTWVSSGDYENDADFRERFQQWISEIWVNKDACLSEQLR